MKEYTKNQSNNDLRKIKENSELNSAEIDVETNFIEYEVDSSSYVEVYADDNNDNKHEQDSVIGFR